MYTMMIRVIFLSDLKDFLVFLVHRISCVYVSKGVYEMDV